MTRSGPIGIHEVARQAGVSITTVSHALNGKGRVSPETRARIEEIARHLGYRANAVAQGLASGRRGLLALQVSGEGAALVTALEYFAQLINGATVAAVAHGYWLTLAPPSTNPDLWQDMHVDGAIIVDPIVADPLLDALSGRNIPVITTGRSVGSRSNAFWVDNDHTKGTLKVLDHLERNGASRIALLTGPQLYSYTIDSRNAYTEWITKRHLEPLIVTVGGSTTEGDAYSAALQLLSQSSPPDAIYATLDRLALGALLAARAKSVAVPDELLIAGLTDSAAARNTEPPLTTLNLHPDELGQRAVEMLVSLVEGRSSRDGRQIVPSRIIPRASSKGRKTRATGREIRAVRGR